jgi:hypothetical protein
MKWRPYGSDAHRRVASYSMKTAWTLSLPAVQSMCLPNDERSSLTGFFDRFAVELWRESNAHSDDTFETFHGRV